MLSLRPCFLLYKELFIFSKLQICRNFWAILCYPFNSSVTKSLLRRPISKYSAMQESWNVPLNSTASKCSSDKSFFFWHIVGDWRLGVHYACNNVFFYFLFFFCVKVFLSFWGRLRERVVFGIAVFSFQISKSVHNPGFEPRDFGFLIPLLL